MGTDHAEFRALLRMTSSDHILITVSAFGTATKSRILVLDCYWVC